ncbi:MAG: MFS transporter [Pseudomonadota bacterium]
MPNHQQTSQTVTAKGLLGAVFFLSIAQTLVGQFVGHGVPLFLRDAGQPGHIVGLVYIASIPYILKILWAPFIDRFGSTTFGHYRVWILVGQFCAALLFLLLSFFDPENHPYSLIMTVVFLTTIMATQDASTSGLMVRGLAEKDRAKGATLRAAASAISGILIGAFVIYLLADRGWQTVVGLMSVLVLFSFFMISFFPLDKHWKSTNDRTSLSVHFSSLKDHRVRHLLWVKLCVGAGLALTYGLKSIVLIDSGFAVGDAALISLVFGSIAGLLAAVLIRPVVDRLGGYVVLSIIAFMIAVYCTCFGILFQGDLSKTETLIFVLLANGLTFAAFPASRSILLGYCHPSRAATDFSAFVTIEGLLLLLFAGIGAALSDLVGFHILLWLGAAGSFAGGFIALTNRSDKPQPMAVKS